MFAARYFDVRYFASRYWPKIGGAPAPSSPRVAYYLARNNTTSALMGKNDTTETLSARRDTTRSYSGAE